MFPAWLLWVTAGMAAREVLPDSLFPKFGSRALPQGAPSRDPRFAPSGPRALLVQGPQAAGRDPGFGNAGAPASTEWDNGFSARPSAPDSLPAGEYVPMDPELPMDPHIDPATEAAVLRALEWEDDKQLDGFAQSISHAGDPFGFGVFPVAASYLRYRARVIRDARVAMERFQAEQLAKSRIERGVTAPGSSGAQESVSGEAVARPSLPSSDAVGTAAPAVQAPPPSAEAVPGVRVRLRPSAVPSDASVQSVQGRAKKARIPAGAPVVSKTAATLPPPPATPATSDPVGTVNGAVTASSLRAPQAPISPPAGGGES
jgi:hypothetical protein